VGRRLSARMAVGATASLAWGCGCRTDDGDAGIHGTGSAFLIRTRKRRQEAPPSLAALLFHAAPRPRRIVEASNSVCGRCVGASRVLTGDSFAHAGSTSRPGDHPNAAAALSSPAGRDTHPDHAIPLFTTRSRTSSSRCSGHRSGFHDPAPDAADADQAHAACCCAAIQRLILASSTSSGRAPSSSTARWNARMSKREPSAASARRRSSVIFSSPILYASP
jgi:hypothetical protein